LTEEECNNCGLLITKFTHKLDKNSNQNNCKTDITKHVPLDTSPFHFDNLIPLIKFYESNKFNMNIDRKEFIQKVLDFLSLYIQQLNEPKNSQGMKSLKKYINFVALDEKDTWQFVLYGTLIRQLFIAEKILIEQKKMTWQESIIEIFEEERENDDLFIEMESLLEL